MTYIPSVWARLWCIYLYIYICVYAQIYARGTFVYCASFVFVVNKLKMRPNWQRRHSICMRGVRGTLDRQPRLEELCAHGQHKRCFKQPPLPHPSPLFPSLSLSSNLSNTFTLRATSMDAFRIAKTLFGVSSYPKCLFPPSHSCSWLYLSLFSHIEGEVGRGWGGGNVRPPSDMIGICKRQQMLHGFRCFALAANCFIIINCPADWNCGQRADDTKRGREMWGGEGR